MHTQSTVVASCEFFIKFALSRFDKKPLQYEIQYCN